MNKKEMSKFCEWAKNDDFLSKFIYKERIDQTVTVFCSPINYGLGGNFLFLHKNKALDKCFTKALAYTCVPGEYIDEGRILKFFKERDTKLDDLSFKDAKDYVYKLAKYGVDCVESLKKRGKQAEIEFL